MLGVKCLAGPFKGRVYTIYMSGLMMGRGVECAIRFDADAPGISRHHCALTWVGGKLFLTDLGSTYGTFLADGRRLTIQNPVLVSTGTRFYLGSNNNLFQIVIQI